MTDESKYQYKSCYAVTGSLTAAQKAQSALARAAIRASVKKQGASPQRKGCAWGVSFACSQTENVSAVLASAGIAVKAWESDDDVF